ncbi:PKD domain-containing protein [Candidatus Neomarinimicrobiota bacterium]
MSHLVMGQSPVPKKVIYETDMCLDVDDAGGLAILHAMANQGEAEILAVSFNEVHKSGVAAIDAMNTWYGRGDIPIGIYRGDLSNPDWSGYLDHVATFPHDLEDADAPSSLDVYRQVLAEQPDSSVTIISVGFLNNLYDLLQAEPDLVAQKVVELVVMAGLHGDGFNLVRHNLTSNSQYVIENWPSPLVISQEGWDIYTGDNLKNAPEENPIREAFYRYFGQSFEGRSSWDEMAALYGVRGAGSYFYKISSGSGSLPNDYTWQMEEGHRSYLANKLSNSNYVTIIERLMDQLPIGAHFSVNKNTGWIPFTAEFDASIAVVQGPQTIMEYLWDFGDGTTGTGETITHEYDSTGVFEVELAIVDNLSDTLYTTDTIYASEPIFSPEPHFGNIASYELVQEELWSTRLDKGDIRLYLNNDARHDELAISGFLFVKDSIYSDFVLNISARTGEELSSSLNNYSIIFGYQDEDNYNQLQLKESTSRLVSTKSGSSIIIALISADGIPDDQYHNIVVEMSDGQLTVTLDGELYIQSSSTRLNRVGQIGFGSDKYSVYFDDISISGSGIQLSSTYEKNIPEQFKLLQNYPNPFNPGTTISYQLPFVSDVQISIYSILGQEVSTLVLGKQEVGHHRVEWIPRNLASGVYFYVIQAGAFIDKKKMILMK